MNGYQIRDLVARFQKYIDWNIEDEVFRFGFDIVVDEIKEELNLDPAEFGGYDDRWMEDYEDINVTERNLK